MVLGQYFFLENSYFLENVSQTYARLESQDLPKKIKALHFGIQNEEVNTKQV